jgi:flagellar basal body rod protein FlgG
MIRGIEQAASAMVARSRQQDAVANNMANAETAGFKRQSVFMRQLQVAQNQDQRSWLLPMQQGTYIDFNKGYLEMSNVEVVDEMPKMMIAQRAFEINSKAVQTADQMAVVANGIEVRRQGVAMADAQLGQSVRVDRRTIISATAAGSNMCVMGLQESTYA